MKQDFDFRIEEFGKEQKLHNEKYSSENLSNEVKELFKIQVHPENHTKTFMFLLGAAFTPGTMIGLCLGYIRGYKKFMWTRKQTPRLYNLPPIVKTSMGIGVALVWTVFFLSIFIFYAIFGNDLLGAKAFLLYFFTNTITSLGVFLIFQRWMIGIQNLMSMTGEHGTARYATDEDMAEYIGKKGLYIGGKYAMAHKGHISTYAGARSGKTVNLIINAILGLGGYDSSWCVIDPKGELSAICKRGLEELGKRVILLNPWDLLPDILKEKRSFNPFDLLSDVNSPHLTDDIAILAEMIVPMKDSDQNKFFTSSARNIISALMLHLMCSDEIDKPSLKHIWEWCRLYGSSWSDLLADMNDSEHPVHGGTIRNSAKEIAKMMESPETFSSIISNALDMTNFLKSSALQDSLESDFDPYTLNDGNTVVFIIIPADKMKSHAAWLRLVTTSMLRACVRRPAEKVTFLYDEVASLGYMSELQTALAAYAGFNITLWLIYQDLAQVRATYGDSWETMVANCTVKHFFGLRDNFSCKYVSDAMGTATTTRYKRDFFGNVVEVNNTRRDLATPDEVKRLSKDNILLFAGENPVALVPKEPYYLNPKLKRGNRNLFDPNPYVENSL